LNGDVLLSETADELGGGFKGLKKVVESNLIDADWAIYTEAHPRQHQDIDCVEIGSRGMVQFEVMVHGRRAHTGQKDRGINAILKMLKVADAIDSMKFKYWKPFPSIKFGDYETPIINVSMIEGGYEITQVPDKCIIKCDCRTLPYQTTDLVMKDISEILVKLKENDPELDIEVKLIKEARAWFIDQEDPFVKIVQDSIEEVIGKRLPVSGVPSTSDARFLMLDMKIPTCKFAFGDILGRRKYVDEYQSIDRYIDTIKAYLTIILNLLEPIK
jgi:acetylornithine deacetylase/succinyl-diaminopimelate desuccinylase-like protein